MNSYMPAAEIVKLSQDKGFAAKLLYMIFTEPVAGLDPIMASVEDHLKHQLRIEAEGVLFGAGPILTEDGTGYEGAGMIIIRANSLEEAHAVAKKDPMHASGARTYRIYPWVLNEGSLGFTALLSNRTVTAA